MFNKSTKILLVVDNQRKNEKAALYKKIISELRENNVNPPKFYLLYVMPHVPSYALQSAELIRTIHHEKMRGKRECDALGKELAIPTCQQFFTEGSLDLKALQIGKQLKADKIFGHSKRFLKLNNIVKFFCQQLKEVVKRSFAVLKNYLPKNRCQKRLTMAMLDPYSIFGTIGFSFCKAIRCVISRNLR